MLAAMQRRAELHDVLSDHDYEARYDELFAAGCGTQA